MIILLIVLAKLMTKMNFNQNDRSQKVVVAVIMWLGWPFGGTVLWGPAFDPESYITINRAPNLKKLQRHPANEMLMVD